MTAAAPSGAARFSCDREYRVISADDALARLLQVGAVELIGRRAIDLVAPSARLAMMDAAASLRHGTVPAVTASSVLVCRDGSGVPVTMVIVPSGSAGGISCVVVPAAAGGYVPAEALRDGAAVTDGGVFAGESSFDQPVTIAGSGRHQSGGQPAGGAVPGGTVLGGTVLGPSAADAHVSYASLLGRREDLAARREALTAEREALLAEREAFVADRESRLSREQVAAATRDAAVRVARDEILSEVAELAAERDELAASRRQRAGDGRSAPSDIQLDTLTGLVTRAGLRQELDLAVAERLDFAVLLVDLDEFKSINDTHGHDVGDEVLIHVAARLRASVRPDDLVVRFGGDEFVVLCRSREAAVTVAERIVEQLAAPASTSAGLVTVTASVGISDSTIPADDVSDLLTRADAAMYWAKRLGKNRYFVYDANLHEQMVRDRQTESLLRTAIDERRMLLYFQPIVDVGGTGVVAVEAVARLIDDRGRMRLPDEFLPIAERSGLICPMDTWVIGESCRRISMIRRLTGRPLCVSVNVSAPLFGRLDFADVVSRALADAGLPASALMLELTESVLLQADAPAISRLAALRERGVAVAIDDFGAGFSPLAFLRRLPLSHVKVSRPWVSSMLDDARDSAMMEALIWLVDQLGLEWVAEGVETDAQWQAVRQLGPGCAQGYLFARPLAEDDLIRLIQTDRIGTDLVDGSALQHV